MKDNRVPIIISILLLSVDQVSKFLILKFIPFGEKLNIFQGLFLFPGYKTDIVYGNSTIRILITILLPVVTLSLLSISLLKFGEYLKIQRVTLWILSGAVFSNVIDRVFRNGDVVEFIQVKFFTFSHVFNIADFTVVICGIIMILSLIIKDRSI